MLSVEAQEPQIIKQRRLEGFHGLAKLCGCVLDSQQGIHRLGIHRKQRRRQFLLPRLLMLLLPPAYVLLLLPLLFLLLLPLPLEPPLLRLF